MEYVGSWRKKMYQYSEILVLKWKGKKITKAGTELYEWPWICR